MSFTSYRLVETSPPGAEPVTLEEAKAQLREGGDDDDALILSLIAASRQACERHTGRALITRGYSLFFDAWPEDGGPVLLPYPPLVAVSSIQVHADDDTATAFPASAYFADTAAAPGRVALRTGAVSPCPARAVSGIEIRYRAGYGAAPSDVPELLRHGILRLIAHLYQRRGDDAESGIGNAGAAALFRPYRIPGL